MHHSSAPPTIDGGLTRIWDEESTASRVLPKSRKRDPIDTNAVRAIQAGEPMIYAIRARTGELKIGCTTDLMQRHAVLGGELLGFKFGDFDEEAEIHRSLNASCIRGREWYADTAEVIGFINELREPFGLEPLAA